jgi:hypothetical protein
MDPSGGTSYISMGITQLQYVPYAFYSLGVAADNVTGVLAVEKGGTGVGSLADLKIALKITTIDTTSLSNRIDSKMSNSNTTFASDITVNGLTLGLSGGQFGNSTVLGKAALKSNTTGGGNTAIGSSALSLNTTSSGNTAVGNNALAKSTGGGNTSIGSDNMPVNTTGSYNTSVGAYSFYNNTTGSNNIGMGRGHLYNNTTGGYNIAIGNDALQYNISADNNIAIGSSALNKNTTGSPNIGIGSSALAANTTGYNNIGIGLGALTANTTGAENIALGRGALNSNTIGSPNVGIGTNALAANTTGYNNIGIGLGTLTANTTGAENIALGRGALNSNTIGSPNVGIGTNALGANTTGYNNVGIGLGTLGANTIGAENIAIGRTALTTNTTGGQNISIGTNSLTRNTTGGVNIALGLQALSFNTTGSYNVGISTSALQANTTGNYNIAIGKDASLNSTTSSQNTFIGYASGLTNTTGSGNTLLGYQTDVLSGTISNATAIGNGAIATASNTIQLGNQNITKVTTKGIIASSKGFLAQGITSAERDAIVSPDQGLIIYCSDCGDNGEVEIFNGTIWKSMTLGTITSGNSTATGLLTGLAVYYPFAGNTSETISGTNTGTIVGATLTTDKFSVANKAYQFDGTSNYISLPSPFFGGVQKSQISISLNFYLDQLPSTNNSYYLWAKNGFWQGLGISVDYQGKLYFGGSITTYKYQNCLSNTNVIAPGQWYNLVIVYNNTDCKMYLNGSLITTVMQTSDQSGNKLTDTMAGFVEFGQNASGNSASTNTFGASHSVSTGYVTFLKGKLDEFRIYDRLLTQTEISYLASH